MLILSSTKTDEEREFYIKLCLKEKYSKRELERQLVRVISEYTLKLIDKKLLRQKLHELTEMSDFNMIDRESYND